MYQLGFFGLTPAKYMNKLKHYWLRMERDFIEIAFSVWWKFNQNHEYCYSRSGTKRKKKGGVKHGLKTITTTTKHFVATFINKSFD